MMAVELDQIGPWSEVKLEIIRKYAAAYSLILEKNGFHHSYIEGFAGAGIHKRRGSDEFVLGSPWNACKIDHPFDKYYFVDIDYERTELLTQAREMFPRLDIEVINGDCNSVLPSEVFPQIRWHQRKRALCLLDPYGLQLDWNVIKVAGELKTIEIFINFPIMDINRNVLRGNRINEKQAPRLNKLWGDDSWKEELYDVETELDLFRDPQVAKIPDASSAIVQAFKRRLKNTAGFEFVPDPIPMKNSIDAKVYYLYFASPNRTGHSIVTDIFNKYRFT